MSYEDSVGFGDADFVVLDHVTISHRQSVPSFVTVSHQECSMLIRVRLQELFCFWSLYFTKIPAVKNKNLGFNTRAQEHYLFHYIFEQTQYLNG